MNTVQPPLPQNLHLNRCCFVGVNHFEMGEACLAPTQRFKSASMAVVSFQWKHSKIDAFSYKLIMMFRILKWILSLSNLRNIMNSKTLCCLRYESTMEKGYVKIDTRIPRSGLSRWIPGEYNGKPSWWETVKHETAYVIHAHRCIQCGYMEPYAHDSA